MSDQPPTNSRKPRNWPSIVGTVEARASKGLGLLEDITRLISEWVWEADVEGRLTYASERVTEVLGYTPLELMGKRFVDFGAFVNDKGEQIDPDLNGPFRELLFRTQSRDGRETLFLISGLPSYDRKTWKIEGYCGTAEDITKLKKEENTLRIAREEADKANLAKSEFLSSMSHELRTPLNGILGFAQLLEFDPANPLNEDQKDKTDQILKSGNHLLALIDEVLELAQIEAGKVSIDIEDVLVNGVFDECLPLISVMAEKWNITLNHDSGKCENYLVRADSMRLRQILLNLMSNAVKYNRVNGSISTSASVIQGGMMRIAVADTGPGIPQDKQSGLFEPFNRMGHESSEIEGTGIGLTITKELIQLMGGSIGFESEVGKGTTFWIDIPLAEKVLDVPEDANSGETTTSIDPCAPIGDDTENYVVLYVEDNTANLALMENIIDMVPNLKMISTHTAEVGIAMAEAEQPDLILMDINLPGISGIEALNRLKEAERTQTIPVIAVSASAMPDEIKKAMTAGFEAYITKPLQIEKLFQAMQTALSAHR